MNSKDWYTWAEGGYSSWNPMEEKIKETAQRVGNGKFFFGRDWRNFPMCDTERRPGQRYVWEIWAEDGKEINRRAADNSHLY